MSLNDATTKKGRDAGKPSNPLARQAARNRQIVLEIMNEAELRLITQKLLSQALQGHVPSIKLVFAYAIGKPDAAIDPDEVDLLEWETRQRLTVPVEEVEALTERIPVSQANAVAEAVKQPVAIQVGQEIVQRLQERGILPSERQAPAPPSTPPSEGERRGVSPPVVRPTGGLTPRRSPSEEGADGHSAGAGARR